MLPTVAARLAIGKLEALGASGAVADEHSAREFGIGGPTGSASSTLIIGVSYLRDLSVRFQELEIPRLNYCLLIRHEDLQAARQGERGGDS